MACKHYRWYHVAFICCVITGFIVTVLNSSWWAELSNTRGIISIFSDDVFVGGLRSLRNSAPTSTHNNGAFVADQRQTDIKTPSSAGKPRSNIKTPSSAGKPRSNIMFLKMHKCASSTVQNILFRYGEKHQLNFVIPQKGWKLSGPPYDNYIHIPMGAYNIWCQHSRFHEKGIASIMPPDTMYVTVLREPASMFESVFTYMQLDIKFNIKTTNPLATFLNTPYAYYNNTPFDLARNPMLHDLGLETTNDDDQQYIDDMIQRLANKFHLVMMTEYFHESLILLKDLMRWSTEDIVYFTLNARVKSSVLTPEMATQIKRWNLGDVKLYDHFNRTFWNRVNQFGRDKMRVEIEKLTQLNEMLRNRCVGHVVQNKKGVWRPKGIDVEALELKPEAQNEKQCITMALTENGYTARIRDILKERHGIK